MAAKFIWYELMTTDREAATEYYKAVVGWNAEPQTMPEMGDFIYTILVGGRSRHGRPDAADRRDVRRRRAARLGRLCRRRRCRREGGRASPMRAARF